MKQFIKKIFVIFCFSLTLQACVFVVGAAAGAAAIAIVYDHRTISKALTDAKIANKISERIRFEPMLRDESHIEVSVFNRVVLLTGETPNPAWRAQADEIARSVKGTARIYNQILIQGPASALTKTSDSWITTKIRSEMLTTSELKSSSIKVVTSNGVVYLMGVLSRQQADIAVDIAREVSGVQKVIKIFQYTN